MAYGAWKPDNEVAGKYQDTSESGSVKRSSGQGVDSKSGIRQRAVHADGDRGLDHLTLAATNLANVQTLTASSL